MSDLRLVLARHGQTPANINHTLDTVLPGPGLTDLGERQAEALGTELASGVDGPVTALYHSQARRARQTAGIVGGILGLEPGEVVGVHEVQAGDLEGRNDDAAVGEFRRVYDAWSDGDLDQAYPGGESGHDLLARYLPAVTALRERHLDGGGTIVLVTHGAALRLAAVALVEGVGAPRPNEEHVLNCGRVVLRPVPDGSSSASLRLPGPGWELVAWRSEVPGGLPATHDPTGD